MQLDVVVSPPAIKLHYQKPAGLKEIEYRKTPNKRPWAFVSYIACKRAFSAFSSFLRNENRTIFD